MARTFGKMDREPSGPGESVGGAQHALTPERLGARRWLPAKDALEHLEQLRAVYDDARVTVPGAAAWLQPLHHDLAHEDELSISHRLSARGDRVALRATRQAWTIRSCRLVVV